MRLLVTYLIIFASILGIGVFGAYSDLRQQRTVVTITDDFGGDMSEYMTKYAKMRSDRVRVKIDGTCQSACTLFFGYFPPEDVCATSHATLGFHRSNRPEGTMLFMIVYPELVRKWIMYWMLDDDVRIMDNQTLVKIVQKCPANW